MSKECIEDTVVTVYDETGVAWSGKANEEGAFDTGCTLKCPGVY